MSNAANLSGSPTERVAQHRRRLAEQGKRRLEVVVPESEADIALIKELASALCEGGPSAQRVRRALAPMLYDDVAKTGRELVAFFQSSPLVGEELDLDRDKSGERDVDLP